MFEESVILYSKSNGSFINRRRAERERKKWDCLKDSWLYTILFHKQNRVYCFLHDCRSIFEVSVILYSKCNGSIINRHRAKRERSGPVSMFLDYILYYCINKTDTIVFFMIADRCLKCQWSCVAKCNGSYRAEREWNGIVSKLHDYNKL